jgi:hypothetical protein
MDDQSHNRQNVDGHAASFDSVVSNEGNPNECRVGSKSRTFEEKEQVIKGNIHGESECCHRHCHFALAPVKIMADGCWREARGSATIVQQMQTASRGTMRYSAVLPYVCLGTE